MNQEIMDLIRSLARIIQQQQQVLESLYQSHYKLKAEVRGEQQPEDTPPLIALPEKWLN